MLFTYYVISADSECSSVTQHLIL